MILVLAGIRVLDFGRYIAGPFCAALLADMGAEVIRIERVEGGEDRYVAPVAADGSGTLFMTANRNKKGMTLDPMKPEGREIVQKLVASADLVVANMPLAALKAMRIDYDSLCAIKPDIILVMASAFGSSGPYADKIGFDTVAQAMSGAMHLSGFGGQPTRNIVLFEDYGTSLFAAFGALCALFERQKSGRGQCVDTSLLATSVNFMNNLLIEQQVIGKQRRQQGNRSYYAAPADTFKTKDGWLVVSVVGNPIFRRWAELMGRADLIAHPDLQDDEARAEHAHLLDEVMMSWCQARTNQECLAALEHARIPCGPVNDLRTFQHDPQVDQQQLLQPVEYPGAPTAVPIADTPARLSRTPGSIRHAAPTLGQDTDSILTALGYSPDALIDLRSKRVI
ncbi:MAG: CoA transferase [Zoogloeaceae bacterium]|nr:CoA transferase [Zoogloeaceae bacterium]